MRHSHGLRAAGAGFPAIGTSLEGGFFAGAISHTANGVATHLLIVAPAATGATGTGYTLTDLKQWKTSDTTTAGTSSTFDGASNSANMNDANHPAAQFCESLSIGGYSDWYLPALYELDIAYQNLKPTTTDNDIGYGINPYSVPAQASNRTAGAPAQTTVTAFQSGGAEAFSAASLGYYHWSSTEQDVNSAWRVRFRTGLQQALSSGKSNFNIVRAFRKVAV